MSGQPGVVYVIGEERRVAGFALAGAIVHAVEDGASALQAWNALSEPPALILLTPAAADALRGRLRRWPGALVGVLPEAAP